MVYTSIRRIALVLRRKLAMAVDSADFAVYQRRITDALKDLTRNSNAVSNADLGFHRNSSEQVSKSLDTQNAHLLRLTNKLLKAVTKDTKIPPVSIKDIDGVDDNWRKIVDVVDDLLEKADVGLDDFNGGITRAMTPPQPETPRNNAPMYRNPPGSISKPQERFDVKVDNYQTGAWRPLLKMKPHALISLEESVGTDHTGYGHPYRTEIQQYQYPPRVYQNAKPISYTHPDNSKPIWVDTEAGVQAMLHELKAAPDIAIDLEHNDKNSYVGLVSLMQISTRNRDWIVDTLQPWRQKLEVLNEVFADPAVVKVFHGSTSDMIWLQRDLGLYVVGLFDTFHACVALNYPQKGLAGLLRKFAQFEAQKQFQLADWRVRPLPKELLDYARADTHYLLYIYDNMRNELVQASIPGNSLIDYVCEKSKEECLQVYERHHYDRDNGLGSDGWMRLLLTRQVKKLDKAQFGILRALHEWRDQKARELDEGPVTIMTNNFLYNCAYVKPETKYQLFGNRDIGRASSYVTNSVDELMEVIKRGKREGLEGPTVDEVIERNSDKLYTYSRFKQANPSAKPQEVQRSVAATMQKLVQNGEFRGTTTNDIAKAAEVLANRFEGSILWGVMRPATEQSIVDTDAAKMALSALLPIQNVVKQDAHVGGIALVKQEPTTNDDANEVKDGDVRIVQEPDIDVPFTLRDRKKKRPADELEAEDDLVATTTNGDSDRFAITDEGKAVRYRDARRAFKEARKDESAATQPDYKPFDYANAEDILQAKPPEPLSTYTKPKAMNPFAKALDTSTGAKRNKFGKEMAGKSHTFKS